MRNFIDIISKSLVETTAAAPAPTLLQESALLEGKHFEAMFSGIEGLAQRYGQEHIAVEAAECKEIVKSLKRNDRQAWAARILRLWMMDQMTKWTISTFYDDQPRDATNSAKADKFAAFQTEVQRIDNKYKGEYLKTFGVDLRKDMDDAATQNGIMRSADPKGLIKNMLLKHYLGMPYSKIQNYVFGKSITQTIADLNTLEQEFKARVSKLLPLEGDDKIIIRMPDNFVWVMLDRGYCDKEAAAMGHCGNAGARGGDHILSLRKIKDTVDGVPYMEAFLTFILNGDGYLGEMKGRGNDKPAERYHPQIITLLQNPIVKGIRGGGWLPKNNFNLDDLPADVKEKLLDTHPHLGGWQSRLQKAMKSGGLNKEFLEQFTKAIRESNQWSDKAELVQEESDQGTLDSSFDNFKVVVHQWDGVGELIEDMSEDDHTKEVAGGDYRVESYDTPSDDRLENFIDGMPVQWQIALGKHALAQMEADGADEDDIEDFDISSSREVVSKLEEYDSEIYMHLQHAVMSGEETGAESEAHEHLDNAIKSFRPSTGKLEFSTYKREGQNLRPSEQEGIMWDSPVKLVLTMQEAARIVDESVDNGDEYEYDDDRDLKSVMFPDEELKIDQPYYGYSGFDEDAALERFSEEAELGELEPKRAETPEPNWDEMPTEEAKQFIETMYEKIPDGFVRKVHPDTLPDDRIRASAKGLWKKYYG